MTTESPITVLLVDDHFVVRSGLAASLDLEDDLRVVAEAADGAQAINCYREHRPRVVVMDLQLPGMNGIEATARLREIDAGARVLIFSTFARDDEIQAALEAGALGYLQKSASREDLIAALRTVAAGQRYLPPGLAEHLAGLQLGPTITLREREILALVARGRANKEIAAALGIAEDTVKRHISNIFDKLEVNDRAQATAEAIRRGIVKLEP
ncbi:MAG: response regulator transcription factor [Verrucomicrobiales bacterium]|nr:response regulator transcription factor [Verrucomicrobiales bacterium]